MESTGEKKLKSNMLPQFFTMSDYYLYNWKTIKNIFYMFPAGRELTMFPAMREVDTEWHLECFGCTQAYLGAAGRHTSPQDLRMSERVLQVD